VGGEGTPVRGPHQAGNDHDLALMLLLPRLESGGRHGLDRHPDEGFRARSRPSLKVGNQPEHVAPEAKVDSWAKKP